MRDFFNSFAVVLGAVLLFMFFMVPVVILLSKWIMWCYKSFGV